MPHLSDFHAQLKLRHGRPRLMGQAATLIFCALVLFGGIAGCSSTRYVKVRTVPQSPLADQLKLTSWSGPQPSPRSMQLLRQYDLVRDWKDDPEKLLVKLQEIMDAEPSASKLYSLAELSYLAAKRAEVKDKHLALNLYGAAVAHSYLYLFDERFAPLRNPYDPEFRGACDLYNGSLESTLRIVKTKDGLFPGCQHSIESASQCWDVTVVSRGNKWTAEDFERFEFVTNFEVQGLTNQYRSFGLGVPLIAVRKRASKDSPTERFYPPELSFPVTAFLRVLPDASGSVAGAGTRHKALLELYDPLVSTDITVGTRTVPLESDLSTPLAYFLNNPELNKLDLSTEGLLRPDKSAALTGLYMLQPYEPGKIPVLMVHGLWSSPMTWMEMFNDLRSEPEIRAKYQFWFYLYPTGQPFWTSAVELRRDLAHVREMVDPQHQEPALDQMVLVGHSMGGLVSKLQTVNSGDDYWHIVSDKPFQEVKASPELKQKLETAFYFQPNPSIRRLITIGTPHRGSTFANSTTRYLAQKLIKLPKMTLLSQEELVRNNPGLFRDPAMVTVKTSLDSLAPESPILPVMLHSKRPPWVTTHNIAGVVRDEGFFGRVAHDGDGVVAFESAHLDDVASEIVVNADHVTVHRHPLSVLEVRRILLEHLDDLLGVSKELMTQTKPPQNPPLQYTPQQNIPRQHIPLQSAPLPATSTVRLKLPPGAPVGR
jgi:pimeloyl-ACP methyl ester carboxylesterase